MKFIIGRFVKNYPFLKKCWFSFLDYFDFKYFRKYCSGYKIIPFGNHCLPRVITQVNRFKPPKRFGEESFPFDLCVSDFSINIELLATNFKNFYDETIYDDANKFYINNQLKMRFYHDDMSFSQFKERYNNRINNLYKILKNKELHIYFLVASFNEISEDTIKQFIEEINCYRETSTYDLIIINQSKEVIKSKYENVHVIDLTKDNLFEKINKKGAWAGQLKYMKSISARVFNHKISSQLSKIIK